MPRAKFICRTTLGLFATLRFSSDTPGRSHQAARDCTGCDSLPSAASTSIHLSDHQLSDVLRRIPLAELAGQLALAKLHVVAAASNSTVAVCSSCNMSTKVLKKRINASRFLSTHSGSRVSYRGVPSTPALPVASTSRLPTPLHTRPFHSTSQRRILPFFGLGSRDTPVILAETFRKHLRDRNAEKLCTAYQALRESVVSPPDRRNGPSIDRASLLAYEDLFDALKLLSSTAYVHADFATLETLFRDMTSLWELPMHQRKDHHFYLVGLVKSGRVSKAEQWLAGMATGASGRPSQPRPADWNVYLQGLRRLAPVHLPTSTTLKGGGYAKMKAVITGKMELHDRDIMTWNTLLAALFECQTFENPLRSISREEQWIRSQMRKEGVVKEDMVTLSTLLSGYTDLQSWEKAAELREELVQYGQEAGALDLHSWNTLVKYATIKDGLEAGLAAIEEMKAAGQRPDKITLETSLSAVAVGAELRGDPAQTLEEARSLLVQLERATGAISDHQTYATLMQQAGTFDDTVELYRDSQRDGVPASSNMLRALVAQAVSPASADQTKIIKSAYSELLISRLSTEGRSKSGMYDIGLYIHLLQFSAREDVRDFTWAIQLLEDVRHNGLSFFNSSQASPTLSTSSSVNSTSASSIVTALMRNAAVDHSQAFKTYSWMWAIDETNIFTYEDWYDVIRTFADLDFPPIDGKRSYVPASVFFAFFEDMRKSGTPPGSKIYQAVLYYYAREGKKPNARANQEAVRQIHDLIKMDQFSDTPDIGLMNRLMYAYAKVGNLEGTFNVWRSVLVNRIKYNNVSVGIILDAYGYAGQKAYPQLVKLWGSFVRQPDFKPNKKNLESYVEALCRLGHEQAAVNTVFQYLAEWSNTLVTGAEQTRDVIEVDLSTLEVLLRFIRADSHLNEAVRQRLQTRYPELADAVRNVATSLPQSERQAKLLSDGTERDSESRNVP